MTRSRKVAAFLVYIVLAIGCREAVIPAVKEDPREIKEPETRELTHGDTFSKLKLLFPHRMLDEKFQTLRELTTTRTYLDFLSQEYPAEKPFQTFDAFLETAPPDSQRYLPFLKEFIENPTDEDITFLHQITQGYRNANAIQHHFFFDPNPDALHIHRVMEKKIAIMENKAVREWFERRFQAREIPPLDFLQTVMLPIENFVIETEKEDARRIQQLFNEHGRDNGTIWLAILEPTLAGEIINNFTDAEVFVTWVKGDFFPDQPIELPQQGVDFLQ